MTDYGKLKDLSFVEWFLLISAAVVLPVVAGLLKQLGFRETEKLLVRFSPGRSSQDVKEHSVDRAARMVSIAARPFKAKCLEQAITLWWMLGLMGIDSTIRLGVQKSAATLDAHAWVLYQDRIVMGQLALLDDYTPMLDINRL